MRWSLAVRYGVIPHLWGDIISTSSWVHLPKIFMTA
jgi:hypothetical protein